MAPNVQDDLRPPTVSLVIDIAISLGALNPKGWVAATELADQLGYESVWLPEHLVVPVAAAGSPHAGQDHPPIPSNIPVYDVFSYFAFLAARTTNIRFGSQVYNVGLRHPFITARAATTVDIVSGGRLLLGIGASWLREEWEAVGLDFDTRGARVDETLAVLQRLWTEDVVEHHGTFFDFGATAFEPKPVQPGGPALHIGGDGPAALRRAATVGAGWIPMNHALGDIPASVAKLRELAEREGRTTPVEVTVAGDVKTRADLDRYAEAGVTRVIVRPWARSSEALEGLQQFASDVLTR
jgi:probable F420-dependent oxidoreductase